MWIKRYDFVIFIKEVRLQLDLSQEDLAREIGVSFATVNRWENRRFLPSKMALRQIEMYCDRMIELVKKLTAARHLSNSCSGKCSGIIWWFSETVVVLFAWPTKPPFTIT